ncbi:MAG: hypothetical protein IPG32_13700 [Saprospirales bacterium]|nr:hypothetical protein [Saprospirales bacterium]
MNEIIKQLTQKPKILFLVDSIGALLTALLLSTVLRTFDEYFGMPQTILAYLSIIPVIFCLYSISCFFLLTDTWKPFLRAISIANLIYCCLTMGLVIYYFQSLTILGVTYFVVEVAIVCALVFIELKTANNSITGE